MRVLIQRVQHASCTVDGTVTGAIGKGFLMFVGCSDSDDDAVIAKMASKASSLRIFEDAAGKMNGSLADVQGSILSISQFTLYADVRKGRRPSWNRAAPAQVAEPLIEQLVAAIAERGVEVATGSFGAHMRVGLTNDGPVTILVEA